MKHERFDSSALKPCADLATCLRANACRRKVGGREYAGGRHEAGDADKGTLPSYFLDGTDLTSRYFQTGPIPQGEADRILRRGPVPSETEATQNSEKDKRACKGIADSYFNIEIKIRGALFISTLK